MTHDADTCRVRPLDDDEWTKPPAVPAGPARIRGYEAPARGRRRAGGGWGRARELASAVGDAAVHAARIIRDAFRPAAARPIAATVGADDLPPGPGDPEEPDPARNPGDLGDRIRRSGPSGDRVFDDTDRELPSDRDLEGDETPFGVDRPLPLRAPPDLGGI